MCNFAHVMNTTIEISNLNTGYKIKGENKIISSGLSAKLYGSNLTCLLGPNGSGKSLKKKKKKKKKKPKKKK